MATEIKSTSIKSQNIIAEPQVNKPGSPEAGQIIQATGTGDIAKGIYHYTGESFFSLDNAQGDLETLRLVLSTDTSAVDFNSALNSTSTLAGNTNAVPHETSTGTGLLGALEIPSTGGDALLTEFDANKVFRYFSAGANNNNDYFGIPIDIPAQTRGQNIVIKFKYRTEEASADTSDGDFQVSVWDKTNGVKTTQDSTLTTGTTISAGSNILMTSKTNLSVGDKIWFETGGTGSTVGGVANSLTQAYITSISSTDNNITVSEDVQVIASGLAVTGWLSDKSTGLLPVADSDTNKVGKDFSIAVKTEETTAQIVLYISNKSTTTNVIELFFDGILVSQNKFLQASGRGLTESYITSTASGFWKGTGTAAPYTFNTTNIEPSGGSPPLAQSKLVQIADITGPGTYGTVTAIKAKQKITLDVAMAGHTVASHGNNIINSEGYNIGYAYHGTGYWANVAVSVVLEKDDYVFLKCENNSSAEGAVNFTATPEVSDVIILGSQDEIFTDWQVYTPTITGGANGANTQWRYRRVGGEMEIQALYYHTSAGTADWSFSLPEGYAISSTAGPTSTDHLSAGLYIIDQSNAGNHGGCLLYLPGGTAIFRGNDQLYNSGGTFNPLAPVAGTAGAAGTNVFWSINAKVPIQGWNSNFNPLMSLPLVNIGSDCEYYNYRFLTNPVNTGTNKSYRLLANTSTGSEIDNTISSLGTIDNSTTEGWSFQASQRVKVHFAVGFACSTTSAGVGIVKLPNAPSTYANEAWGHSQWDDLGVGGTQDTRTGAGYQGATSASFIMEPGEYIQAIIDNTNVQNSAKSGFTLLVERDRSNTNMAHIIKPAVAILKDVKAYNEAGGASTSGAFNSRELNVVEGESYFVTLSGTGTKGISGTNVEFTLDPGMYKMTAKVPFVGTNFSSARLYDVTNSQVVKYGSTEYTNISTDSSGGSSVIEVVKTITAATQYKIQYRVSDGTGGNGLGVEQNTDSTAVSVYTTVEIEKLK